MKKNARQIAFEILLKIEKEAAYSNLALDELLKNCGLDTRDKSFVSALVYGVTEKRLTLDYELSLYLSKPIKKLKNQLIVIMRMGAYQIFFMDKVPTSAAVNESVKLAKNNNSAYAASLVNAIMRKCASNGLVYPTESSDEYLSVRYSCPNWLIHKWTEEYSKDETLKLLQSFNKKAETIIRVNTLKTDCEELKAVLATEGVESTPALCKNSLQISLAGHQITSLKSYKNGLFHVQDTASQLCAAALDARPGEIVFDLCAAPGGKSFTVAENMNNKGKILAFDLHESRVKLINDGAKRLGIDIISAQTGDAELFNEKIGFADRVLCDVPCSGLGIIRRKPEIRYKEPESLNDLPKIQLKILMNASKYVKSGGRLVYSTCTLSRKENDEVCAEFLKQNSEFRAVKPLADISDDCFVTLMPHKNESDGFFVAAFEKRILPEED